MIYFQKSGLFLFLMFLPQMIFAQSSGDTMADRLAAYQKFEQVYAIEDSWRALSQSIALGLPIEQHDAFQAAASQVDMDRLKMVFRDAAIATFNADELAYLTQVYSNPLGRSAMEKSGRFMSLLIPVIQSEIIAKMK